MYGISRVFPEHLPKTLRDYRDKYEHHLILKMSGLGIDEARHFLKSYYPSPNGNFFECTVQEGEEAFLHRFAAAGAGVRLRGVREREIEDIVALDVALRRNDRDWFESLPPEIEGPILHKLYYGLRGTKGPQHRRAGKQDMWLVRGSRGKVPGRAQFRSSLPGSAVADRALQNSRSHQLLESWDWSDV